MNYPYAGGSGKALIAKEIDSFHPIHTSLAMRMDINYLDITGSSGPAVNDAALIATGGLHRSGLMFEVWAEGLVPFIKKPMR